MKRVSFTLIELIAAIAIIAVTLGIAVSTLRSESPALALERASLELESFCARVRYRAAEEGREWAVLWEPDKSSGSIYATPAEAIAEKEENRTEENQNFPRLILALDMRRFTLESSDNAEGELSSEGVLELFRFFPDGGAAGGHRMELRCGSLQKNFTISKLTGRLIAGKDEP